MLCCQYPQFLNIIFKHQLFLESLIARTKSLDLGVSKSLLVNVLTLR